MNGPRFAAHLGSLLRVIQMMLDSRRPEVGGGLALHLMVPNPLGDGEGHYRIEAGIKAARPAPSGELLWVDFHLVDGHAERSALCIGLFNYLGIIYLTP